jgi:predicted RecB family nuclease
MYSLQNNKYRYSPSDLVTFLGCHHATFLDVKNLTEELATTESSGTERLLQKKGLEHEKAFLQQLKDSGKSVNEIPKGGSIEQRAALTHEALKSGVDVIYQAVLDQGSWHGEADFLLKCGTPSSSLGPFSYEVLDTKLTCTAEPKHIIQLCVYSELLTHQQGICPQHMHLFLGDGNQHSFKVSDFFYYYQKAKQCFEEFIQNLPQTSYPDPCNHCQFCRWRDHCTNQWQQDNHLSLVANIQHSQREKLRQAGITTVAELAATAPDIKIPDLNRDVFLRLRSQAILQTHKARTNEDTFEILPFPPQKGFSRLPEPHEGDLFFDMEGDPLYPEGLEYLFGVYYYNHKKEIFKPFWAHNHEEEKQTFQRFMKFLEEHLNQHPNAHIYHYNHYETTALKRLACRYAVCEEQLDNLLRQQKFVDLYLVVRESIRTSEPSYSIKNLETFYMTKRANTVATAADSILVYNTWRETGEDQLLQDIAAYNQVDCVSTHLLRDWLLNIKPEGTPFRVPPETKEKVAQKRKDWEAEYEQYQNQLRATLGEQDELGERIIHLLEFHNREAKPQWWGMFDRQNKFEDELIDDTECLSGLVLMDEPEPEKRSLIYTYKFPPQEYKLKEGDSVTDAATGNPAGTIFDIDEDAGIVKLKIGTSKNLTEQLSIGPSKPIDAAPIRKAIYRFADSVLNNDGQYRCIHDLLGRALPRITGKPLGEPLITFSDLPGEALEAIANLDNSYLFIQGPPGAGKTYTSSHIIVELMRRGKKIGISSNSHKAIHNLLHKVEDVAKEQSFKFRGIKKGSKDEESEFKGQFITNEPDTKKIDLSANLFAGTAWLFANEHFTNQLDYLFIDEAGQVALANVVAMATSARNIVLIGDQMQLGQPIQGTHPGEAGLSVLEFLLRDQATIPPERGIFLGETRRIHPSICQFISEAFYEGRLHAHDSTSERSLSLKNTDLPNEGIHLIPTDHEGCSQKSTEEGEIIKAKYQELLGQQFHDQDGTIRAITEDDILVVTPYNVQVNYLKSILPPNARVGTVDKFQGQEAPIVLISMVTSSAEDLPRNIEFLYSKNRLNVAISRAQCLAVVVVNPKLLEIPCKTVEQMKLVNTFCWLEWRCEEDG